MEKFYESRFHNVWNGATGKRYDGPRRANRGLGDRREQRLGQHARDSGRDQTRFSFDQTRVQSLEAQVLAQPEIRQAKVQSLQQAIGNGEYSVSAGQIADAMASDLGAGTQD